MSDHDMRGRVEELTSRYAGVAPNPHLFRDILAFEWLKILNVTDDSAVASHSLKVRSPYPPLISCFARAVALAFRRSFPAFFPLV